MRRRLIRAARTAGLAVLVLVCLYLVGRAVVEVAAVDPGDHASYHDSWGGPSYLGVLAVHCLPGVVGAAVLWWVARRGLRRRAARAGNRSH